jgi:hypothetical protein
VKRGDLIVIILVLAVVLAGALFYFFRPAPPPGAQIVIQVEGEDRFFFPLYQAGRDEEIEIHGYQGVTLVHLAADRVWVVDSACPDKICVNTGWTNSPAKPIACLPNRVIIKIAGEADGRDLDLR